MAAPQMTVVFGQMSPLKQDQAKQILTNHHGGGGASLENSPIKGSINSNNHHHHHHNQQDDRLLNISGGWGSIHSDIAALSINDTVDGGGTNGGGGNSSLLNVMSQLAATPTSQKSALLSTFLTAIKETTDDQLVDHHK